MNTGSIPRHSRREFIQKIGSGSFAASLKKPSAELEITDFSVCQANASAQKPFPEPSIRNVTRRGQAASAEKELLPPALGAVKSGAELSFPTAPSPAISLPPAPRRHLPPKRRAAVVHTELLSGGKRLETFDNGTVLGKDALGRVIEVFATSGESLLLSYDDSGELCSFTRTDAQGRVHSTARKGRQSVTVRDADGRAKAIGECMTIDHLGRFFLHTHDGQYFSIDLISNIHCERRRLVRADGKVSYVTAAFAHDGFRMATAYARNIKSAARQREITYRFYGRDGSVIEFGSEEEFRDLKPTQAMPPCTIPVHKTWRQRRQAHTAWESVNEYMRGSAAIASGVLK